jgi:hypothetical protein
MTSSIDTKESKTRFRSNDRLSARVHGDQPLISGLLNVGCSSMLSVHLSRQGSSSMMSTSLLTMSLMRVSNNGLEPSAESQQIAIDARRCCREATCFYFATFETKTTSSGIRLDKRQSKIEFVCRLTGSLLVHTVNRQKTTNNICLLPPLSCPLETIDEVFSVCQLVPQSHMKRKRKKKNRFERSIFVRETFIVMFVLSPFFADIIFLSSLQAAATTTALSVSSTFSLSLSLSLSLSILLLTTRTPCNST